ncbi:DNA phosphorothioation system sulfurtransferase DndC [Microcoleus sp. herbarium14]|uniref:DNA phosphorothioation system sulfurtransferase DndC n=1 Tax=Microcoleus sp. herbarium14 TaxID=3055439 RepID=UPI002FD2D5FE
MIQTQQMSLLPGRSVTELIEDIELLTEEVQELYCLDDIPWVIGYSGGKDSTAVVQLIWNAIAKLPQSKQNKRIDIITTDTLVENPIVSAWVRKSIKQMNVAAIEQNMPIGTHLLQPEWTETFWVGLIGKGYPAPRGKFRWCTDRLKISPSNRFIRNIIRSSGETILVLGTRKAESTKRAHRMKKMEARRVRDRLSPNMNLPNSLVYSPIEDWRDDEVWLYLMQWDNPWGYSNKDLFAMYRGASADNECPLVVDTSTPSCGSSRFGCWVCTMVSQDKSLTAMIQNDEEKEWLQPLLDFRVELDVEDSRDRRDFRRRNGNVQLYERNLEGEKSIEPIPGPYSKEARDYLLMRLLSVQTEIRSKAPEEMRDITLIFPEELSEIRRIWLEERHEFDDSLPRIYEEVTGEPFADSRPTAERKLLGSDEWTVLEEICSEDKMHLELMAKLLDTERQYYTKLRRTGIYGDLDKCFETSSRSRDEAIGNAHYQRNLKKAVEAVKANPVENFQQFKDALAQTNCSAKNDTVDIAKLKEELESNSNQSRQLSWADIKYSTPSVGDKNSKD